MPMLTDQEILDQAEMLNKCGALREAIAALIEAIKLLGCQ